MNESPDYIARRDELRSLSRARARAGLSSFPSDEEVKMCAANFNMTRLEAHNYLMHEGERILEIKEGNEKKKGTEKTHSSSESS